MSTAARMLTEVFRPKKDAHPMTAQQQLAELLQIKRDYIDPLGPAAQSSAAPSVAPVSARDGEDARRYRWLRGAGGEAPCPAAILLARDEGDPSPVLVGAALDAAIDRAMGGE